MTNIHHYRSNFAFIMAMVIITLLFGIFSIVWLRSEVRTLEYTIAQIEDQKMKIIKERKALMAEKASLLSIQSVRNLSEGKNVLVFPDRAMVTYVKKDEISAPYRASLKGGNLSDP